MTEPTETDWAYLAGFFEGDGSIIARQNWNGIYYVRMTINQRHAEPLDWIHRIFGGRLHSREHKNKVIGPGTYHTWIAAERLSVEIIRGIYPYLKTNKKLQIDLILKLLGPPKVSLPEQAKLAEQVSLIKGYKLKRRTNVSTSRS